MKIDLPGGCRPEFLPPTVKIVNNFAPGCEKKLKSGDESGRIFLPLAVKKFAFSDKGCRKLKFLQEIDQKPKKYPVPRPHNLRRSHQEYITKTKSLT
jgi:hypothetical protein